MLIIGAHACVSITPYTAVLPGTGWLAPELRDNAIDWVMRRPEGHVVSSKIHFATRLHRDPDSWTNPRTPQRWGEAGGGGR